MKLWDIVATTGHAICNIQHMQLNYTVVQLLRLDFDY